VQIIELQKKHEDKEFELALLENEYMRKNGLVIYPFLRVVKDPEIIRVTKEVQELKEKIKEYYDKKENETIPIHFSTNSKRICSSL
jgi:hypothetical protein